MVFLFSEAEQHCRMPMVQHLIKHRSLVLTRSSQLSPSIHEAISPPSSGITIGPTAILIIIILAFLFLMFCILHLLIRHLIKHQAPTASYQTNILDSYPEMSDSDALQRQLQGLFQLHDSGLEQYLIDKLPVFQYKEILGLKDPFDCAVCLGEFSVKDKLRLLPFCSHAFHIDCIDTWLVSNSTCPLCRSIIFNPELPIESTMYDIDDTRTGSKSPGNGEIRIPSIQKTVKKGVLRPVRLGKFRRLNGEAGDDNGAGETSSTRINVRRCYSMGSYQYVVGDSNLRVALSSKDGSFNARKATTVEHNGKASSSVVGEVEGKKISNASRADSYSVSKIWLWSRRGKPESNAETSLPSSSLNMDIPSWIVRRDLKIVCD